MDLFECSVCLNDMIEKTPRVLFCLHTFCTDCLQQLINQNKVKCPTCREVTELKSNDVKELKVNFHLCQMKEKMKDQEEKEKKKAVSCTKTKSLCQICHQSEALYKCKDCPHLLCDPCKVRHSDIEDFKSHSVFDLCLIHDEGITHLCKECIKPLCTRCMLLDHIEHKNHFVNYEIGIEELQDYVRTMQELIKNRTERVYQKCQKIQLEYQRVNEVEAACQDQKRQWRKRISEADITFKQKVAKLEAACNEEKIQLEKNIQEADEILKETGDKKKTYTNLINLSNKEQNNSSVVFASLNALSKSKSGFCDRYNTIKQNVVQCLKDIRKVLVLEVTGPPIVMTYSSPVESDKPTPSVHKLTNLKVKQTLLTIEKSDQINGTWDIAFVGNDVLLTTRHKPYHVIRLDLKGRVVNWYYPQDTDKLVKNVFVYDNDVYILQSNTITVIPHCHEQNIVYNLDIESMWGILVKDKSTIFISQNKNPGNIYKYDTVHDTTEVVVEGLKSPSYMSVIYTKEGCKYIISEMEGNFIKVYNSSWELLHLFGGQGTYDGQFGQNSPMATTVTDMGTILVADQGNHRISHFTIEGQFLSHVTTIDDGIKFPIGLCYKHPYLWVTRSEARNVKCLEITKTA